MDAHQYERVGVSSDQSDMGTLYYTHHTKMLVPEYEFVYVFSGYSD
jgi:hypothetical protein